MTESAKDGGLAFGGLRLEPTQTFHKDGVEYIRNVNYPGLSVRDYFAARIIGAIIAGAKIPAHELRDPAAEAQTAYEWADAMLKVREAGSV